MRTPLYKQYAETKAVGYYCMGNFGGLEILAVEFGFEDYAVACFNFGTGRQKIRRHKIQRTQAGRPFIRKNGTRFYFDEIMAV